MRESKKSFKPKTNSTSKRGKLLVVAYFFPPIKSMASYRNYGLVKEFASFFDATEVITTTNYHFFPKEYLDISFAKFFYSLTIDYRTFLNSKKASGVSISNSPIQSFFRGLKNSFPFNLILDLGGLFYIFFAIIIGLYRIKINKTTYLLSFFPVFADHIVAYCLKRLVPSIYWIADFHHVPFLSYNNELLFQSFQKKINHHIISYADAICTVSEGLVPHLQKFNKNIDVIELGIINLKPNLVKRSHDKFTISYTGSLYPKQTLVPLLKAIKKLIKLGILEEKNIQFQYAGTSSDSWNSVVKEHELEKVNVDFGVLSLEESLNLQYNSHINLLLSWTTPELKTIIPGKFYDYLVVDKPILLLINGDKDESWEERIKNLNIGLVSYANEDGEKLSDFITCLYRKWEKGELPISLVKKEVLKSYYLNNQVTSYLQKIGYLPC